MQMFTPSRASRRSARRSNCDEELSKPVVGSSKINREGSITISSPTFTRFLWPPEIPRFSTVPTSESLTACRPKDSITLSITRTLSGFARSADNLRCYGIQKENDKVRMKLIGCKLFNIKTINYVLHGWSLTTSPLAE